MFEAFVGVFAEDVGGVAFGVVFRHGDGLDGVGDSAKRVHALVFLVKMTGGLGNSPFEPQQLFVPGGVAERVGALVERCAFAHLFEVAEGGGVFVEEEANFFQASRCLGCEVATCQLLFVLVEGAREPVPFCYELVLEMVDIDLVQEHEVEDHGGMVLFSVAKYVEDGVEVVDVQLLEAIGASVIVEHFGEISC